jgi:hypothetical protein
MEDMNLRTSAPWIIAGVTVVAVALIVCLTLLALEGKSSDDLSRLMNTALNLVTLLGVGGSWLTSRRASVDAAGAREEARTAAEQTNGQLDTRIRDAVAAALASRGM